MSTWQVFMNDVRVGALTDDRYQAICSDARRLKRLYVWQAFNVLFSTIELVIWVALISLGASIMVTGYGIASQGMDPDSLARFSANPLSLIGAWYTVSFAMGVFGLALVPICFTDRRLGFRNFFKDHIALRIRQELSLPYPGSVVLKREPQTLTEASKEESSLS